MRLSGLALVMKGKRLKKSVGVCGGEGKRAERKTRMRERRRPRGVLVAVVLGEAAARDWPAGLLGVMLRLLLLLLLLMPPFGSLCGMSIQESCFQW